MPPSPSPQRPAHRRCPAASRALHRPAPRALTLVLAALAGICLFTSSTSSPAASFSGYLSAPTDQIAVPGMLAGGEITPEGDLYTGWGEYELRIGRRLNPWAQPTRTLPDPSLPLLRSVVRDGPVRYTQTVFAVGVAGRPVAYISVRARNLSDRPRTARVAMAVAYTRGRQIPGAHGIMTGAYRYERPATGRDEKSYVQPGRRFSAALRYATAGRDLIIPGALLARGPDAPSRALAASRGPALTAAHDGRLFRLLLKPHAAAELTWQVPLSPPPPGAAADLALDAMPLRRARAELARAWRAAEAPMMGISVPEPKVTGTYRAAITEILASRYESASGWVQGSNKLQYQAFWIRDGAIDTQALDLAGLHAQAAQNLAFMDSLQQPDGLYISRPGQYDGLGQALWALDQHAELAQDPGYAAAQLGRIGAAVEWLASVAAADPLGLLPPANPLDNELAYGHITGDNLWAAAGLRSAVADARLAGRADLAQGWLAADRRFESSLQRAIALAVRRTGHIPPVLDSSGGQDWGNYYAAYPVEVLPAASPAVSDTVAWARAHMAEGLPLYDGGRSLHDYLGFSVFQTELAASDTAGAVAGLYSELVHTTSTDGGWEWDVPPFGRRASPVNLSPHGTFAGDYVALLRDMLISETAQGGVRLLAGASPAWLAAGSHISVSRAPTRRGTVSFTEHSSARGESLWWSSSLTPGTALAWALPAWARHARDSHGRPVGSELALSGRTGSIAVTFGGRRPGQSYLSAVAALNGSYRAHGRPPPLVAAGT